MTRDPLLILIGAVTAVLPTTLLFLSVNILFFVPLLVGLGCVFVGCRKSPEAGKESAIHVELILCLAAAIGPFALSAYFNRPGKPVRIVLPEGFRGEFLIVRDREKGQDLKLQDGEWLFEIPASGVLVINDDHPFCMWHQERFAYSDGRSATVEILETTPGSIITGANSSIASTDYDGTTHHWKVLDAP
jgi:hypothetical protein